MDDLRDVLRDGTGNRGSVLRALMIKPGNQADLAKRSRVVPATIGNVLNSLDTYVRRESQGRENRISLKPLRGIAVGVELGYQRAVVVLRRIDTPSDRPETVPCDRGARNGAGQWVPEVMRAIRDGLDALNEPLEDVATVGLGVPGIVHPKTMEMVEPRLPLWTGDDNPAAALEAALRRGAPPRSLQSGVRVKIDNDATLGALAESVYTHADTEVLLFVKSSTGVGAGIVVGPNMLRGAWGGAGELGHLVIDPQGAFCLCGGRGCLQTVVGSEAMVAAAATAMRPVKTDQPPNDMRELIQKAQDGNQACTRVVREAGRTLGAALGNVCNMLNPNVVVLGGTLSTAGRLVVDEVTDAIRRTALPYAQAESEFRVVTSQLPHPAALGALVLGIQGAGNAEGGDSQN